MKIYKLGRVSKAALSVMECMNYSEIDPNKFLLIRKEDVDKAPELYKDTARIISPVRLINKGIDINLIRKTYGIPSEYRLDYWKLNPNNIKCNFSDPNSAHKTTLIINNIKGCCSEKELDYYIFKATFLCEVDSTEVNNIMKLTHDGVIGNEGLYYMSSETLKRLNRTLTNKIPTNTYNAYCYIERK